MDVSIKEQMKKDILNKQDTIVFAQDRRSKFALRYEMFNDNFAPQVKKHLTDIYQKASTIGIDRQMDLTNNIYKNIVNKISRVYSFGCTREFSNPDTEQLYRDLKISKIMKEANLYANAFNDVLLQVSWNYEKQIPKLIFRYPHKTRVELDEYSEPKEVEYFVSADGSKEKWAYWTKEEHYYKIYDKDEMKIEYPDGNEQGINPYGILPFVFMQNGFRDGAFFDEYNGQDLVYITLDNAVYSTFKNYLIKWQSFKQLVITGNNIGSFSGQMLDPSSALTASGENVSVNLLDLTADLEQLRSTIESAANNVAINYNISPSQFRLSGQVSSGFALQMENTNLDEYTREQQADFVDYEKELFALMKAIILVEQGNDIGDFSIKFQEPTYQESKSVELDATIKEVDLGLKSVSEVIAQQKGISIDEAKAMLDENLAERNKVYNKVDNGTKLNFDTTAQQMGL